MGCLVSAGAPHSSSVAVVNAPATVMIGLPKNQRFAGGLGKGRHQPRGMESSWCVRKQETTQKCDLNWLLKSTPRYKKELSLCYMSKERKLILKCFWIYFICVFCLHGSASLACSTCDYQKRVSYPLGLELLTVMSHHVGAGNLMCVLCKSSKCS